MNKLRQKCMLAENYVAEYLVKRGWHILARNFRHIGFELDIVAQKNGVLHVFEVKYRSRGFPCTYSNESLISSHKKRALEKGARYFCYVRNIEANYVTIKLATLTVQRGIHHMNFYDI